MRENDTRKLLSSLDVAHYEAKINDRNKILFKGKKVMNASSKQLAPTPKQNNFMPDKLKLITIGRHHQSVDEALFTKPVLLL